LCGRREDRLIELKKHLSEFTDVCYLVFDVRNISLVEKKIQSLADTWIDIDVLVNNAGNAHGKNQLSEGIIGDWDAMIDSNVKGLLYVSKTIIPNMISRKSGHIINISSIAGKETYENGVVYCASKKAVESISQGMRLELTKHDIKVSNIAPGAVETEFSEVRFKGNKEKACLVYKDYSPLLPEDVSDLISYILSCPERVTIADVTILPKKQSSSTVVYKNKKL
jgi:NADP-dependent 3-hydroxy acid dehydrogenase YdfG